MTLTEFLLARIAEDQANLPSGFDCWYDPDRYARECEAKKLIAEEAIHQLQHPHRVLDVTAWFFLRCLALPYANHPDYDQDWRP